MDCTSVHGIPQASVLDWVAIRFSRGSSSPRGGTWVSCNYRRILHHLSHPGREGRRELFPTVLAQLGTCLGSLPAPETPPQHAPTVNECCDLGPRAPGHRAHLLGKESGERRAPPSPAQRPASPGAAASERLGRQPPGPSPALQSFLGTWPEGESWGGGGARIGESGQGLTAWHTAVKAGCHPSSDHSDYSVKGSPLGRHSGEALGAVTWGAAVRPGAEHGGVGQGSVEVPPHGRAPVAGLSQTSSLLATEECSTAPPGTEALLRRAG